ncbi:hypothetical protein, partial [Anaplasma bovis]|uniref:hypothetical protein n=1 Tax=Anaplasma bovis TaxID=186733 RepID=UPI002FF13B9B
MSAHFSRAGNEKLCMLLSFFGATYSAGSSKRGTSDLPSSTVLRNMLEYDRELDHMCVGVISKNVDEIRHRKAISDALFSEITRIHSEIENVESSLNRQCRWYNFLRQISKFFLSTFTIHKLYHSFETMKKLDGIFRNSTAFGDCTAFFLELRKVEKTSKNTHTSSLFKILNKVRKEYKPVTHGEYVSAVKNCFMSSTPTQILPLSAERTSGLHYIKKVGINPACKRTSLRVNDLLNRVLSPGNLVKPLLDVKVSHFSPLFGAKKFSRSLGQKGPLRDTDKKNRGKHSLLSEPSKTFLQHLYTKKAICTSSTVTIIHPAANDSPSEKLSATDTRPILD